MKLLTAGCGISQISFPHWPTWVKYPTLTHELEHVNIGGPASGNEFLAHNIIRKLPCRGKKALTRMVIVLLTLKEQAKLQKQK